MLLKRATRILMVLSVFVYWTPNVKAAKTQSCLELMAYVNENQKSAQGTVVTICTQGGEVISRTILGKSGRFKAKLQNGASYYVRFDKPGCIKKQIWVEIPEKVTIKKQTFSFNIELFEISENNGPNDYITVAQIRYLSRIKKFSYDREFSRMATEQAEQYKVSSDAITKK